MFNLSIELFYGRFFYQCGLEYSPLKRYEDP